MSLSRFLCTLALLMALSGSTGTAVAGPVSLFQNAAFQADRAPLIAVKQLDPDGSTQRTAASLFAGQSGTSLFARLSAPNKRSDGSIQLGRSATAIERIRHLIAQAEAGPLGYDAIQYGATKLPDKRPTKMTIAEIYAWIDVTPGQNHAIGRYQFIPATLRRLVKLLGAHQTMVFSPQLQDRLADLLLAEAGLDAVSSGDIGRHAFMNNMARIWAGLPASTGKSHYDGYAGNQATMTWAFFDSEMLKIFPG